MKTTRKVTYELELSEKEYTALRLLAKRVREHELYVGGEEWRKNVVDIIGEDLTDVFVKMFVGE